MTSRKLQTHGVSARKEVFLALLTRRCQGGMKWYGRVCCPTVYVWPRTMLSYHALTSAASDSSHPFPGVHVACHAATECPDAVLPPVFPRPWVGKKKARTQSNSSKSVRFWRNDVRSKSARPQPKRSNSVGLNHPNIHKPWTHYCSYKKPRKFPRFHHPPSYSLPSGKSSLPCPSRLPSRYCPS